MRQSHKIWSVVLWDKEVRGLSAKADLQTRPSGSFHNSIEWGIVRRFEQAPNQKHTSTSYLIKVLRGKHWTAVDQQEVQSKGPGRFSDWKQIQCGLSFHSCKTQWCNSLIISSSSIYDAVKSIFNVPPNTVMLWYSGSVCHTDLTEPTKIKGLRL